jgi:PD-(D/E)XK endonuclease
MFVSMTSNHKGNVAELAFAKHAAALGLSVLKPLTEHERYDLALALGTRILRVQCKWARSRDGVVAVQVASSRRGPDGYIRRNYSAVEVDAVGIYCDDLDRCFLVPIDVIRGQWRVQLRFAPARNGQRAALHFADEYELGAVAQLEERRHGMAEAEGSSPSSSIDQDVLSESAFDEVGAHEFRNPFGYYLEKAAAGTEILVRRRGKPYVCVGPCTARRRYPLLRSIGLS